MAKVYITTNVTSRGIIEIDLDITNTVFEGYLELPDDARNELKTLQYRLGKKQWFNDLNAAKIQANKNVKSAIKKLKIEAEKIALEIERLKPIKF
ncbi:hypothetical protein [Mucilaginibacter sp. 10I4]|uniref:hypothetical protein n=1 Tax=Mucilaginibacter sp. 10I4 TaxID=3048580 RepID=UPI002B233E77|nr:hypothetical protein [Mucilaginibacter sp. 10I4]MEB0262891.1 hypothetical protein [Mucilaginibacter sp. 10I4]